MNMSGVKMAPFAGAGCLLLLLVASVFAEAGTGAGEDLHVEGSLTTVDPAHQSATLKEESHGLLRKRRVATMLGRLASSSTGLRGKSSSTKLFAAIAGAALALGVGGAVWECLKEVSAGNSGAGGLSGKHCRQLMEPEGSQAVARTSAGPVLSKKLIVTLLLLSAAAASLAMPTGSGVDPTPSVTEIGESTSSSTEGHETLLDFMELPQPDLPEVRVDDEGKRVTIGWRDGEGMKGTTTASFGYEGKEYEIYFPDSMEAAFGRRLMRKIVSTFKSSPKKDGNELIWSSGPSATEYAAWGIGEHKYILQLPPNFHNLVDSSDSFQANVAEADAQLDALFLSFAFSAETGRGPTAMEYDLLAERLLNYEVTTELKRRISEKLTEIAALLKLL